MILIPSSKSRTYLLNSKPNRKISVTGEVQGETLNTQCVNRNLEAMDLFNNELRYLGKKKKNNPQTDSIRKTCLILNIFCNPHPLKL